MHRELYVNGRRIFDANAEEAKLYEAGYDMERTCVYSDPERAKAKAREYRANGYNARSVHGYSFEAGHSWAVFIRPNPKYFMHFRASYMVYGKVWFFDIVARNEAEVNRVLDERRKHSRATYTIESLTDGVSCDIDARGYVRIKKEKEVKL